jgi:hypothetical protein
MIKRADPPVSEAQRRAMRAAAGGHSTLGIPQDVGEEYSEADPGGALPERKDDDCAGYMDAVRRGDSAGMDRHRAAMLGRR